MRYQISGKQLDIGEALQSHVKAELGKVMEKYTLRPTDVVVVFTRDAHLFVCECTVHLSSGLTAKARGEATEIYAAFEVCCERMDKQLRRHKRKLRDHHRRRTTPVEFAEAPAYIVASAEEPEAEQQEMPEEADALQPLIIAETATRIPTLSPGEAVMQMELANVNVLVFRNERHGNLNVVYRREDGKIGWIDPR